MMSATSLANSILKRAFRDDENVTVTPLKLQKLIYLVYKDYLQKTKKRVFSEEILAWPYGPVVESVYKAFKSYKDQKITKLARSGDGRVYVASEDKSPQLKESIDDIWDKYKGFNGKTLSQFTHREGTAWYKAVSGHKQALSFNDIKNEEDFLDSINS